MTGLVLRYEPLAFLRDPLGQKYLGQGFCSSWRAEVSKHILSCLLGLRMTSHHITISFSIYFVSSILSYLFLYCDSCQILFNFNPRPYFSQLFYFFQICMPPRLFWLCLSNISYSGCCVFVKSRRTPATACIPRDRDLFALPHWNCCPNTKCDMQLSI